MMIAVLWDSNIDAAVTAGCQKVIEPQAVIAVLTAPPQPRSLLSGTNQQALFDLPASIRLLPRAFPAREVFPVKEATKTKFRNLEISQQELTPKRDFHLNADMPDRFFDTTYGIG